jgi:hypothetical protein
MARTCGVPDRRDTARVQCAGLIRSVLSP